MDDNIFDVDLSTYVRVYEVLEGPSEDPNDNGNYDIRARVSNDNGLSKIERTFEFSSYEQAQGFKDYLENVFPSQVDEHIAELREELGELQAMKETNDYYVTLVESADIQEGELPDELPAATKTRTVH